MSEQKINQDMKDTLETSEAESATNTQPTPEEALAALQEELDKMKDQWLRSVAELENVRRRAQKDREDANKYAITAFARELLSVSDNLARALESVSATEDNSQDLPEPMKALIAGIEMTQQELKNIFERQSIVKINPINQKFDPNLHQAMFEIENNEIEPGIVLQVLQSGYTIHDRLLRPALVGVSKQSMATLT